MKLKYRDIKKWTKEDMEARLKELKKELMKIYAQRAMHTIPENPSKIKLIKKNIARILQAMASSTVNEQTAEMEVKRKTSE